MTYVVKEAFATLQGEGAQAGRVAVFCRFARCNLWSGHEDQRANAICRFCDTDFVGTDGPGGGRFATAAALAEHLDTIWPASQASPPDPPNPPGYSDDHRKFVVCTGGEPLLQVDHELVKALHDHHYTIAIETNGTLLAPAGIDWICVSPKAEADLVLSTGDELKLVFPQVGGEPELYAGLAFHHFYLQPMDGPDREHNTKLAIDYCLAHPQWRLSVQTHKYLGIP